MKECVLPYCGVLNKTLNKLFISLLFTSVLGLSACGSSDDKPSPTPSNRAPVSNAGADKTVAPGATISLNGSSSSDSDGDTLTYLWSVATQPEGATVSFSSTQIAAPTITVDLSGVYVIKLVVNDGKLSDDDTITVTVATDNTPPESDAGPDLTLMLGDVISLDGSGSSDSDGDELSYQWSIDTQPTGASASFGSAQSATSSFITDTAGTYIIQLAVSDGVNVQTDTITLILNQVVIPNAAPTSQAGSDQTVTFGALISLDGSASSDPDGDSLTYQWTITTQPADAVASFSEPQNAMSNLVTNIAGVYVVSLTVSDGELTHTDTLSVTIQTANNTQPVFATLLATPSSSDSIVPVLFTWNVSDVDGDSLTCTIDVDDDGTAEYTIADCSNSSSQAHIYATGGNYTARVTINDGNGGSVQKTVAITINNPPVINSFFLSPDPAFVNSQANFSWNVSDMDGDSVSCSLDIDNDGTDDYSISDCLDTESQAHTFNTTGDYSATLTISDGKAPPVIKTITYSVIAPLATDVTANGPAIADQRVLYSITVGNTTQLPIDDVRVSLVVPAELSFSTTNDAESDSSHCGNGFCTATEEASWALGTLAAGESRTIAVNALVSAATLNNTTITLPVTFNATDISDIVIDKQVVVYNTPSADLALSASIDPVVANQSFTYQLDFGNTSASTLANTELRAYLPAGVSVVSISDGGSEAVTGEVVWTEGSVSVGASMQRTIEVMADADLVAGQILTAKAELSHDGGQVLDNSVEYALTVVANTLPLQVDISSSANPVIRDERVLYSITVGNTSQLPVDDVWVQLRVPAELSFSTTNDAESDSSHCGNGFCTATEEASWSLGTLAAGESRTLTVNALVGSVLSGNLIVVPVRVTAVGLKDVLDLRKVVAVYNTPSADLALSASVDPVVANQSFTYQLDFGNTSASTLANTELRAYLPAGVSVVSISDGGSEAVTGEVVWTEGSVGSGNTIRREVTVIADDVQSGSALKLLAQLVYNGGLITDQSSEYVISVSASAPRISASIAATPATVASNGVLSFSIEINNDYSLPVDGVNVVLRLPAEYSFHYANDAEPNSSLCGNQTCTENEEASWSLGTMAVGASQVITVNAKVVAGLVDGNLVVTPIRVTATGMTDTINLQHVTVIDN